MLWPCYSESVARLMRRMKVLVANESHESVNGSAGAFGKGCLRGSASVRASRFMSEPTVEPSTRSRTTLLYAVQNACWSVYEVRIFRSVDWTCVHDVGEVVGR